jgi:hypothetical protein
VSAATLFLSLRWMIQFSMRVEVGDELV